MTDPAIRAALDAAASAAHDAMVDPRAPYRVIAAAAVAAFLRALPAWHTVNGRGVSAIYLQDLAAAVERAAGGDNA